MLLTQPKKKALLLDYSQSLDDRSSGVLKTDPSKAGSKLATMWPGFGPPPNLLIARFYQFPWRSATCPLTFRSSRQLSFLNALVSLHGGTSANRPDYTLVMAGIPLEDLQRPLHAEGWRDNGNPKPITLKVFVSRRKSNIAA